MATRDFYNILGIERGVSSEEIKRAYRALARRWHPDLNPGDGDAETRFRDVNEAYRTLSDPDKRLRYDRLGPFYTEDGRPPRPEELNAVVARMWSNFVGRRSEVRGEDLRMTVAVPLEEVATGVDKVITVPRRIRCTTCQGDGADPDGGKQTCTVCNGSGRASGPRLFRSDCYHCAGRGFRVARSCAVCRGDGRLAIDDAIRVKVPAGVVSGQKLKVAGRGNAPRGSGKGSGEPGDLYVVVTVADHPLFRRREQDVLIDVPLSFHELLLGGDVTVPTLDGVTTIRIPPGSAPGKVLRLAGRGLPAPDGRSSVPARGAGDGRTGPRGDLHLQLVLELPAALSDAQRQQLEAWTKTLPKSSFPRRATFDQLVQERR